MLLRPRPFLSQSGGGWEASSLSLDPEGPAGEEAAGDSSSDAEPQGEANVEGAVSAFIVVSVGVTLGEIRFDGFVQK